MWIFVLLAVGCSPEMRWSVLPDDWRSPYGDDPGDTDTDTGEGEVDDTDRHLPFDTAPPEDTGDSGDSGDPGDTDPPPEDPQACYPGPSGAWTTCVDLVDYSSSWGSDYSYPAPYGGSAQYAEPLRFVDLSAVDPDLALAANFVLDEVMQEHKGRYAVYQTHVIEHMQSIRTAAGGAINVNSGYRSPAYNSSVDGATHSRHMYGDAADMSASAVSLSRLSDLCDAEGAGYIGMYSSFVHCDWRLDALDPAFYGGSRSAEPAPLPVHTARIVRQRDGALGAPATGFDEGEPYRQWRAYDASGTLLIESVGSSFEPPADAAEVLVEVGGRLAVRLELP